MPTSIRCYSCRTFFDMKLIYCPECDSPRRGFNKYLRTAELNNHLFRSAESADNTRKQVAAIRRDANADIGRPPKWARQAAKTIVAGM